MLKALSRESRLEQMCGGQDISTENDIIPGLDWTQFATLYWTLMPCLDTRSLHRSAPAPSPVNVTRQSPTLLDQQKLNVKLPGVATRAWVEMSYGSGKLRTVSTYTNISVLPPELKYSYAVGEKSKADAAQGKQRLSAANEFSETEM
ncbi:hypothetical protein ElyMa_006014400 [Elysia marginata]|uniref:Uncharacterized protein n=1 Tax=Elysia marginata TaxID=1093978 RepID=A0AAV4GIP0_9GAST|nr:hypothetical protein ElyMa_006014400 [Elysia marginata]